MYYETFQPSSVFSKITDISSVVILTHLIPNVNISLHGRSRDLISYCIELHLRSRGLDSVSFAGGG